MISRLISWLEQANLDLGDEDIADAIWLAMQMGVSQPTIDSENDASDSTTQSQTIVIEEDTQDVSSLPEFSFSAFPADAVNRPPQESTVASEGLPFQAPAAVALQNALELGRSLRPLMRKVPSPTRLVLDEEATVNSIIEQQIWQPVLMPAPERWLDLELVVEASPLSHIWQQTIADFQYKVLERQGAFRNVRAWTLQNTGQNRPCLVTRNVGDTSPRIAKPEELVHPSGRRLVMLISDCRSDLWQQAPPVNRPNVSDSRLSNIYCWLSYWANHGPVLLIQLLPDWLWERSALGCGFEACLSSLTPAVANALFDVQGLSQRSRDRADVANALKLLVTTLDADLLLQCAEVIAGAGEVQAAGVIFNLSRLPGLIQANQSGSEVSRSAETNEERAERLVDTFLATASPEAQQLAGMMAAVPVSLPVVHLLQAKLLPNSSPVNVAEVYMSGLLKQQGISELTQHPIYEFQDGVRKRLNQAMPRYTTELVLETLSQAIAEKLGIAIASFAAFLSPKQEWLEADRTVARFAEILPEVLRNLGEDYAGLVEQAEAVRMLRDQIELPEVKRVEFPSLAILDFETAHLVEADEPPSIPSLQVQEVEVVTIVFDIEPGVLERFEFEVATIERRTDDRQPSFLQELRNILSGSQQHSNWVIRKQQRQAYQWVEQFGDRLQLEMVAIPAGTFMMGSPEDELDRSSSESPQHEVNVPTFFMGKYPITQAQWRFVAKLTKVKRKLDLDPSRFKGDNRPVERVSWYEAVEFCTRLSTYTGREYRLPTEAEWEYACRAGTTTHFHFGKTITTDLVNYDGNYTYNDGPKGEYREETTPVDYFGIANAFGLCDMHGNVFEWCLDHWHEGYEGAPIDGSTWLSEDEDTDRVRRGGSWYVNPGDCRSAYRNYYSPDFRNYGIGFRVVCIAPKTL